MAHVKTPYLELRKKHGVCRPRWVPGPRLRARGYHGQDLKDEAGNWLSEGAAIDAARKINAAVEKALAGDTAPIIARLGTQLVGTLVDEFLKRPKLQDDATPGARKRKKPLAKTTIAAYKAHAALLKAWAGDLPAAAITPAMVENCYDAFVAGRGLATANAIMRSWKTIFIFAIKGLHWKIQNPIDGLETDEPDGRLVLLTPEEIESWVAASDWLNLSSVGDAITLGLLTVQRRNDLLTQPEGELEADSVYRFKQSKTGRTAKVKAAPMLLDRLRAARNRKTRKWGTDLSRSRELICEATGAPYAADGAVFGEMERRTRLVASGLLFAIEQIFDAGFGRETIRRNLPFTPMPSLAAKWFRDLRDTGITWLAAAGCDRYEIATVSGLSLKSVDAILDKHYFVRDDSFAISAGDKLTAYLAKRA